jgi:hypothetical protein
MKKLLILPIVVALTACGGESNSNSSTANLAAISELSRNNDTTYQAQPVQLNSTITGNASINDRFDYYSINVTEGQTITISIEGNNSATDLDIALFESPTSYVAFSEKEGTNESFEYTATFTGIMYVEVLYYEGPLSTYTLNIQATDAGPAPENAAEFCVEATSNNQTAHQIVDGSNPSSSNTPIQPGACPNNGYVSQCSIEQAEVTTIMKLSQDYIDIIGGHSKVETEVCDAASGDGIVTTYSYL